MPDVPSRKDHLLKKKVIAFIDEKRHGQELSNVDLKMMPHILSMVSKKCKLSTFHAIMKTWNFPQLFAQPHSQKVISDLRDQLKVLEHEMQLTKEENDILKRTIEEKEQEIKAMKYSINELSSKRQRM